MKLSDAQIRRLLQAAQSVRRNAYAPYSKFHVGAALLASSGQIFTGCNVENASFGLTICAERNALFHAISQGQRHFTALAIVAPGVNPTPCGACRQVLAEFGDLPIFIATSRRPQHPKTYTLAALLPEAFDPRSIAL